MNLLLDVKFVALFLILFFSLSFCLSPSLFDPSYFFVILYCSCEKNERSFQTNAKHLNIISDWLRSNPIYKCKLRSMQDIYFGLNANATYFYNPFIFNAVMHCRKCSSLNWTQNRTIFIIWIMLLKIEHRVCIYSWKCNSISVENWAEIRFHFVFSNVHENHRSNCKYAIVAYLIFYYFYSKSDYRLNSTIFTANKYFSLECSFLKANICWLFFHIEYKYILQNSWSVKWWITFEYT